MRTIGISGRDAPRRAGATLLSLRRSGVVAAAHLLSDPDDGALPDTARCFVTADGRLLRNDAFWLEWGSARPLAAIPPDDAEVLVVVGGDSAAACGPDPASCSLPVDAFGRPLQPSAAPGGSRIAILGRAEEQGAALAALGDAADRLGIPLRPILFTGALPDADGLVLPGGADMSVVERQIVAAQAALRADLPLLGLCLGMQALVTAALRSVWPETTLEEIAGAGSRRSFVRLRDSDGKPGHNLGDRRFQPAAGSRLAALLPAGATVRTNHRYCVADDAAAALPPAVRLHRRGTGSVDAVELPGQRFCMGLQGHPELGCDTALHGLWDGFLKACHLS